jgi:hypothetical protein
MENEFDYLVADENCKQALTELIVNANRLKWIKEYKWLFQKVTIRETELPRVVNANFNGVIYGYIVDFCREYQLVELELTN